MVYLQPLETKAAGVFVLIIPATECFGYYAILNPFYPGPPVAAAPCQLGPGIKAALESGRQDRALSKN